MKNTLYDVLLVSNLADQETISVAYQRLLQKLQSEGSQDSQNRAKFVQSAYDTLSNPDKKALYDQRLQDQEQPRQLATSQNRSDFDDVSDGWWKTPKVTLVIVISAVFIGFSLFTGHTGVKNKVEIVKESEYTKRQANELNAANVSKHLDNEGSLVKGTVENESKHIDESANVANRIVDVANREEDRRRIELEYRANANAQQLELQRKREEAAIELQRRQQDHRESESNAWRAERMLNSFSH